MLWHQKEQQYMTTPQKMRLLRGNVCEGGLLASHPKDHVKCVIFFILFLTKQISVHSLMWSTSMKKDERIYMCKENLISFRVYLACCLIMFSLLEMGFLKGKEGKDDAKTTRDHHFRFYKSFMMQRNFLHSQRTWKIGFFSPNISF